MTLTEKERALLDTIAMPEASDWQLLIPSPKLKKRLIQELNEHLGCVLTNARNGAYATWGDIGQAVFGKIQELNRKYPDAGLADSEGYLTIARFFAVNYQPAMYDFFRYYGAGHEMPMQGRHSG